MPAEKTMETKISDDENDLQYPGSDLPDPFYLRIPKYQRERYVEIALLINHFASLKLNEELRILSLSMLATLGRKKTSPIMNGTTKVWAAVIINAIGKVNFLFDKKKHPHITKADIADILDVSKSTLPSKTKEVLDMLDVTYFDERFSTQEIVAGNPLHMLKILR